MTKLLDSTLVLCDLDHLLLAGDGNMPQVVRDVLQLFSSRGGRLTVFSQRSPRAVRAVLGGLRLAAPALTCGGTLAYRFSEGSGQPLCSFAGCEESIFKKLPAAVGLGIALQMADGSTRVLRMSTALERHLRREFTPFTLCSPADVKGEDVLRILLYQDRQQLPIQALLEKALGDNAAMLRSERTGMDVIVLTPGAVSAEAMLGAVCLPVNCTADQLTVAAGCSQMLELVRQAKQSGLTKRAYLARLIEGQPVKARPSQEIKELRTEIHHIGNNINQIARSVNAGIAKPEDAKRGLYLLDRVYELMYQVAKK